MTLFQKSINIIFEIFWLALLSSTVLPVVSWIHWTTEKKKLFGKISSCSCYFSSGFYLTRSFEKFTKFSQLVPTTIHIFYYIIFFFVWDFSIFIFYATSKYHDKNMFRKIFSIFVSRFVIFFFHLYHLMEFLCIWKFHNLEKLFMLTWTHKVFHLYIVDKKWS